MKAMILAAGKGERMRPLTLTTPKPLLEVNGQALIIHHIRHLKAAGITEMVLNVSWLGEQIKARLQDGKEFGVKIQYSEEPAPLETAGGIRQALPLLISDKDDRFIVVNGDIYCDYDFLPLTQLAMNHSGHIVLVDNPPHHHRGDFSLSGNWVTTKEQDSLTFSGISLLSRKLFDDYDPNEQKLGALLKAAMSNQQISGEHYTGTWHDIGTPDRLKKANIETAG